ncbi:hypothetical protein [Bacillus sp. 1P02SD]|uniref:hypothetical protein n=1 Tax=Bacillus sp. 1P02SD TaxID=3132264 RepID=UPI0039A06067
MKLEDRQFAVNALRQMFIGSQFDGIKFGLSSPTTFLYFVHYSNHEPDLLWINIDTKKWFVFPFNTIPNSEKELEELTEEKQYNLLYSIRREQVIDINLGDVSPHLYIKFNFYL